MKLRIMTLVAAGLLTGLIGGVSVAAPQAPVSPSATALSGLPIEQVATKKVVVKKTTKHGKVKTKRTVKYSVSRYGPRYKVRRPGYGYYYGGYWYSRPWWTAFPGPVIILP
ncbi:hypothetical protein [Rhodoligotrophos defluvii]|uniref:hypothetical protein n=1 Tax=Rhodoligotrophos defluvii TaxID=2561934 RepID=UPI0010C998A6|nr:hypothetical protein [Rhodoligotrophos defluvii]